MGKKYHYYKCATKGCEFSGKSISKDKVHDDFLELLKNINPCDEIVALSEAIFEDQWASSLKERRKQYGKDNAEKVKIEAQIERLTELIVDTKKEVVTKQYEKQIEKLGEQAEELEEKIQAKYDYSIPYRTSRAKVFEVLKKPYIAWKNYDVHQKQRFFSFIFEENLIYDKEKGYRTPEYSLPIRIFQELSATNSREVEMGGIEPPSLKLLP